MANTIVSNTKFVTITTIDADYDHGSMVDVSYIMFHPGSAADKLVVKDGTDAGPTIFHGLATTTDPLILYVNRKCRPLIDQSEGTFSAGHKVIIGISKDKEAPTVA
jgi:hypothetical protein